MLDSAASPPHLSPGVAAMLAILYEASAPKPGNVYPGASFDDLTYADLVIGALASGPILVGTQTRGVGPTVLGAVRATRNAIGTNSNLGTLLLIAPLAAVPRDTPLHAGIQQVLKRLTADDTRAVYEAIRLANAGGLGRTDQGDVYGAPPPISLVEVMSLAADRDLVARQYANDFSDVFRIAEWIAEETDPIRLSESIVLAHIRQLAGEPDSLIARKCGLTIAAEASQRAAAILAIDHSEKAEYAAALSDYDAWLRTDGHLRNPGTTADLIAAALYVLLREGRLKCTEW